MSMSSEQLSLARLYLADQGTDEAQSIQIDGATGGSFTITWDGQTTSAIAWDAGANEVQNAFCALPNVGVGNATVIQNLGVPGSVFFVIYFAGELAAAAQPIVTVTSSLTGTPIIDIQEVTQGGITAFTDDELNALYADAQQDFYLAVAYGFRALMANAAKFNDYVLGQSEEKKSQIFKNLSEMVAMYTDWSQASQQVQFVRLQQVPPRVIATPSIQGVPTTSLNYGPPFRRGWRGW